MYSVYIYGTLMKHYETKREFCFSTIYILENSSYQTQSLTNIHRLSTFICIPKQQHKCRAAIHFDQIIKPWKSGIINLEHVSFAVVFS